MQKDDLKKLAKTELHCHLDGSLSLNAIRCLAAMAAVEIPKEDAELRKLVTAPESCESLKDYLKTFDFIRPLLQTKEALHLAAYDVAKQAALENVIYIEIRFAPELSMDQGLSVSETVEAVCAGLLQAQKEFGIVAKALICGMRHSELSFTKAIFSQAKAAQQSLLVGADFAGNEADYPAEMIADGISHASELGFPMTFHAGEQCGCAANIAYAMQLGVRRIGHATVILEEKNLLENFVAVEMTAEVCLTSNLQTKAIQKISEHPYPALKSAGARISINTDNRTVSNTNLTKEYALYEEHFGSSAADFLLHNQDAIRGSFASRTEKKLLLSQLEEAYEPYL
ncbi:adenosine deaminase [Streptococcus dentiloxodontae]